MNPSPHAIDWRAFLARPPLARPSPCILDALAHARVLITGAGGSIGSALALRLAKEALSGAVLLDASEIHLYQLQQALGEWGTIASAKFVLGNAGDDTALDDLFSVQRPRLVFHAAAHKHVPLLERQPWAAIANNIFATETLVAAAVKHGARVVLLSTDKAVQPASVMGATKRVAEEIVLRSGGTVLRLGNVLGSSGSVTEIFREQAARGGPLTVTDAEARRYFLTMEEAVDMLLSAAQAAMNSDAGLVLVPALDADHSVAELAAFVARRIFAGHELAIEFTGLRPGDKLTERLWEDDERVSSAGNGLLLIHSARPEARDFAGCLAALRAATRGRDLAAALAQLGALVPGYRPSESVLALARNSAPRVCA